MVLHPPRANVAALTQGIATYDGARSGWSHLGDDCRRRPGVRRSRLVLDDCDKNFHNYVDFRQPS